MKIFIQILIVLVIIITCKSTDPQFLKRSTDIDFGQDILKTKYSYDNQLIMVIRKTTEIISLYDGRNFNFLKNFTLYSSEIMLPIDFQFVDDYLVVAAVQKFTVSINNLIFVYKRNSNTQDVYYLTTFQTYQNFESKIKGLRFEKLNSDYLTEQNKKIQKNEANGQRKQDRIQQLNSTKRLVIWSSTQLQVYQYRPKQYSILKYLFSDKIYYQNSTFRYVQFYDQTYLLLSHEWVQQGLTVGNLIVINIKNKTKQAVRSLTYSDSVISLTYSALQIKARTDQKFLILTTFDSVKQFQNDRQSQYIYYNSTLNNNYFPNLIYDDARLIGYFNSQNILIYRVDNAPGDTPNPRYSLRFSQVQTQKISIALISPNSGQLLLDNCNGSSFSYYSICPEGSYYNNTIASQQCVNCSLNLCSKCINDICTSCVEYHYLKNQTCISCSQITPGCKDCSSSYCTECYTGLHRVAIPDPSTKKCLCEPPYIQNSLQLCVICPQSHCLNCMQDNICAMCDSQKGWVLTSNKCTCADMFYQDGQKCSKCKDKINSCNNCFNQTTCTNCTQGYTLLQGQCNENTNWSLWFIITAAGFLIIIGIICKKCCKKKQQMLEQYLAEPAPYLIFNQQEKRALPSLIQSNNNIPIPQQAQQGLYQSFKSNDSFLCAEIIQKEEKIKQQNRIDQLDDITKILMINKIKQQIKTKRAMRKRDKK